MNDSPDELHRKLVSNWIRGAHPLTMEEFAWTLRALDTIATARGKTVEQTFTDLADEALSLGASPFGFNPVG